MEDNLRWYKEKRIEEISKILVDKEYITYNVFSVEEAEEKIYSLLDKNSTVAIGDSWELINEKFIERLREFKFFDRFNGEQEKIKRESLTAETAIIEGEFLTEKGQIVFVGDYNTSSALFGAENVIVLLSENKIVKNLEIAFLKIDELKEYYELRAEKLGNINDGLSLGIIENGRKFEKRITVILTVKDTGIC